MNNFLITLKQNLIAQKRKAGALGALMLILVVVILKTIITSGPRQGRAAQTENIESTEETSLAAAGQAAIGRTLASLDARTGRFIEVPASATLTRDLFAMNPEHFPIPAQTAGSDAAAQHSNTATIEQSAPTADELRARREAQLLEEVSSWRLKSVLLSRSPTAVIEISGGKRALLTSGQSVQGWTLIEIGAGYAVLEQESVRTILSLANPER